MKIEEYNAEPVQVSSRIPLVIKENILYPKTKKAIRYGSTINLEERNKNTIEQNQWASPGKMKYIKEHLISRHVKNQSYQNNSNRVFGDSPMDQNPIKNSISVRNSNAYRHHVNT
jgi:hypothetical protein